MCNIAKSLHTVYMEEMVVAQCLPLTPEICGSNPDIDKVLSTNFTMEKTFIKK